MFGGQKSVHRTITRQMHQWDSATEYNALNGDSGIHVRFGIPNSLNMHIIIPTSIIPDDGVANAIVVGGMGRERNLIIDKRLKDFTPVTNIKGEVNREGIRRMTPREWARLQGFPEEFNIVVADASAYKQFGNSVAIPAIKATAEKELKLLGVI